MNKHEIKANPADYSHCALYRDTTTGFSVAIVANTIPNLQIAWDFITDGKLPLDHSKVQRVEIHKKR